MPIVAVTSTTEIIRGASRVRVNEAYVRALEAAGLTPVIIPPLVAGSEARQADEILARVDGLVLTGGEDIAPARYGAAAHPELGEIHERRDATELALTAAAREVLLPTLAICRGIQLLAVALGGALVQDLPSERPGAVSHDPGGDRAARVHGVRVEADSRLALALGATELTVNSFHHQAVGRLGSALRAVAWADDGTIEGIETPADSGWWAVAVQWHPEELMRTAEPWDRGLFAAFATEAARAATAISR